VVKVYVAAYFGSRCRDNRERYGLQIKTGMAMKEKG